MTLDLRSEWAERTWAELLNRAQADADSAGELDWLIAADSTLVRVHQHGAAARRVRGHAATARGQAEDDEEGSRRPDRAAGRS
jgi:hypothetical protein